MDDNIYGKWAIKVSSLLPGTLFMRRTTERSFKDSTHSDNCVVMNELHFLVHLPPLLEFMNSCQEPEK